MQSKHSIRTLTAPKMTACARRSDSKFRSNPTAEQRALHAMLLTRAISLDACMH
jgi:hypothetical protein